jgi:thiol-disulfide isomerase/thioredoxin
MVKLLTSIFLITSSISFSQTAEVIKFETLKTVLEHPSAKVQVINFWATWCAPCVKELPLFEKLNKEREDLKITLVSLDFSEKIDKVNSFLMKKEIKSTVLLLDEVDYNKWIDEVDKEWTGAIPATLIINTVNGKRKFIERELQDGDLEKLIEEVL